MIAAREHQSAISGGGGGRRSRPGRSRRGSRARRRRSRSGTSVVSTSRGRAERDLAVVEAQHPRPARGPGRRRAWRRAARGPRPAARRTRARSAPRSARSTPDSGSSSSSTGASCTSARAISTRWRWPPESVPKRSCARSASPTRSSAASAAARSAAATRRNHGVRPYAPISATSCALTGKSSRARSVCGTYAGRPASATSPVAVRQLAEQRAEERRLAAAVGAEHGDDLARRDGEARAAEHVAAAHVPAAQVVTTRAP